MYQQSEWGAAWRAVPSSPPSSRSSPRASPSARDEGRFDWELVYASIGLECAIYSNIMYERLGTNVESTGIHVEFEITIGVV